MLHRFEETRHYFLMLFYDAIERVSTSLSRAAASWPSLYTAYARSSRPFSPSDMTTQLLCVREFLNSLPGDGRPLLRAYVHSHIQFLTSRVQDPHNCLVGSSPSLELLHQVNCLHLRPLELQRCFVCGCLLPLPICLQKPPQGTELSSPALLQLLLQLDQIEDPLECKRALNRVALQFRESANLPSQDHIVLVSLLSDPPSSPALPSPASAVCSDSCRALSLQYSLPLSPAAQEGHGRTSSSGSLFDEEFTHIPLASLVFARYAGPRGKNSHLVLVDGYESDATVRVVAAHQLLVLPPQVLDKLQAIDAALLRSFTYDPMNDFFQACFRLLRAAAIRALSCIGAPGAVIHQVLAMPSPLSAFPHFAQIEQALDIWQQTLSIDAPDVQAAFAAEQKKFTEALQNLADITLKSFKLPALLLSHYELELSRFQTSMASSLRSEMNRVMAQLEIIKDACRMHHLAIIQGEAKDQLTVSWLNIIKKDLDLFLSSRGFILNAVSNDYIDQPIQDMSNIFHNKKILSNILDPSRGDPYEFLPFVLNLRDKIYIRIDRFFESAMQSIQYVTKLDIPPSLPTPQLLSYLQENTANLPTFIPPLVQDLVYMDAMRLLDQQFSKNIEEQPARLTLSDVVPISGLIFNRIYRLEQELDTIIELHQKRNPEIINHNDSIPPSRSKRSSTSPSRGDRLKPKSKSKKGT